MATATDYWMATATATALTTTNTFPVPLTKEQRDEKSCDYQFGLCDTCDAGLDDRADFVVGKHATYTRLLCNDCSAYYAQACTALRVQAFLTKMNESGGGEPCECDGVPEKGDY